MVVALRGFRGHGGGQRFPKDEGAKQDGVVSLENVQK